MKRFYGESYFEKCKINIIDYSLYHYDVLCYKISTLKDLYFKLVNYLYDLKLKGKSCSWKSIEKKEEEINNPFLFHLLRENYNNLSVIDNRRNKSAHEGKIEHAAFKDISPYVMLTMYSKTMPISDDVIITRGSYLEYKLKSSRKKFLEETEICKYNAFIFTRCILCSLSETFIQKIDNDTKNKYSATLEKIKQETQGNKCSIGKKIGRNVLIKTKKSSFKNDFLVCRLIIFQFFTLQFHISRSIFQFKCSVSPKENEKYKVCNQCFHFYSPCSSLLLSLLNENVSCSNRPKLS